MNQDTLIRGKVNEQLNRFSKLLSKGLKLPEKKFLHQVLSGIQASRDIKLSEIAGNLEEKIRLIKTENRLSRNMRDNKLSERINRKILEQAKRKIEKDTVLAAGLTSIHKPYAKKMNFLTGVWPGMEKRPSTAIQF